MIYIALGSNLPSSFGNRYENLNLAISLIETYGIQVIKRSSFYETLSFPDRTKPKFINVVLKTETHFSAQNLMKICLSVEKKLGRKRNKKNEPRICDIDIIDYDNKVIKKTLNNDLSIRHPKMHKRNFVLLPLFEISKRWKHPLLSVKITKLIKSIGIFRIKAKSIYNTILVYLFNK